MREHRRTQNYLPPLWFIEGLAEYCATDWDADAEGLLRDAVLSGEALPLTRSDAITGTVLMYKEGQSFLLYLAERFGEREDLRPARQLVPRRGLRDRVPDHVRRQARGGRRGLVRLGARALLPGGRDVASTGARGRPQRSRSHGHYNLGPARAARRRRRATPRLRFCYFAASERRGRSHDQRARRQREGAARSQLLRGGQSPSFESFHLFQNRPDASPRGTDRALVQARRPRRAVPRRRAAGAASCARSSSRTWSRSTIRRSRRATPPWCSRPRTTAAAAISTARAWRGDDVEARAAHQRRLRRPRARRLARRQVGGVRVRPRRARRPLLAVPPLARRPERSKTLSDPGTRRRPPAGVLARRQVDRVPLDARRHQRPVGVRPRRAVARGAPRHPPARSGVGSRLASGRPRPAVHRPARGHSSRPTGSASTPTRWRPSPRRRVAAGAGAADRRERCRGAAALPAPAEPRPRRRTRLVRSRARRRRAAAARSRSSDVLGNEQFYIFLSNDSDRFGNFWDGFEGGVTYINRARRLNWGVGVFRLTQLYDADLDEIRRERRVGMLGLASYPFSKFTRVEGSVLVRHASDHLLRNGEFKNVDLVSNFLAFVHDNSRWTMLGPSSGTRLFLSAGFTRDLTSGAGDFATLLGEVRHYAMPVSQLVSADAGAGAVEPVARRPALLPGRLVVAARLRPPRRSPATRRCWSSRSCASRCCAASRSRFPRRGRSRPSAARCSPMRRGPGDGPSAQAGQPRHRLLSRRRLLSRDALELRVADADFRTFAHRPRTEFSIGYNF